VDYLRYTERLNTTDTCLLGLQPRRAASYSRRAGSNQTRSNESLSWRVRHDSINLRLIRGETSTAGDLSTLRSISALVKVKNRHVERVFIDR
jgi:hypothetical protein